MRFVMLTQHGRPTEELRQSSLVRDIVGGLVDDDQIETSIITVADWLAKLAERSHR
jgi:hypothetical protein